MRSKMIAYIFNHLSRLMIAHVCSLHTGSRSITKVEVFEYYVRIQNIGKRLTLPCCSCRCYAATGLVLIRLQPRRYKLAAHCSRNCKRRCRCV